MPKVGENFLPSHDALNPILVVDLFDIWGIGFMGPFLPPLDTSTFWWELTMCRSGLKQSLAE